MPRPVEQRRRTQMRQPRVAEIVAASLRDSILRGELTEGDVLPRQEDLLDDFNVSPPAVREAMRILETEGLITVRRGNVGGAIVHLPTADRVAYMVSLVLQSQATSVSDVGAALRELEPLCAAMCAARPDRAKTVVPQLQAILQEQEAAVGDVRTSLVVVDRFHEAIVQGCGNATMILMVGSLESVWTGHAIDVYERDGVAKAEPAVFKAALRAHEKIVAAIERGDAKVDELVRAHLEATHAYMSSVDGTQKVTAASVSQVSRFRPPR